MSLLSRILFKITAYCRCRIISGPDQQPYLERYHLMRLPFGYRAYLHRFVASDPGRGLHNHPWRHALSWVLSGSYQETRMADARADNRLFHRKVGAGSFNFISGDVFHRVNLEPGQQCWTLFIHAPQAKTWGFLQSNKFIDHNELVSGSSNPLWWKQAERPVQCPEMRLPYAA